MQMSEYIKNLPGPIIIVGMGKSGQAAFDLLQFMGHQDIFFFDDKNPSAHFQDPQELNKISPKTLVVSPGYPLAKNWIQDLKNAGSIITSELSLAASCIGEEQIIGITGSVAKSTTVSILEQGAKEVDANSFTGGNLGTPFCSYALSVLKNERPQARYIILELSSYQLENCANLHLAVSGLTYLSPNHLERYTSLEQYYDTKLEIMKICDGPFFVNQFGGDASQYTQHILSRQMVNRTDPEWSSGILQKSYLIGEHNLDNLAMAFSISRYLLWGEKAEEAMLQFKGLPHRLETVAVKNGVLFINDSKATALDSVQIAVQAALSQNPRVLHLLIGGRDKNLPWEELQTIQDPRLTISYFGECGFHAKSKMQIEGEVYSSLSDAFSGVVQALSTNDIVLLSPGGTSLDEFKSFEERGNFFKKLVMDLP